MIKNAIWIFALSLLILLIFLPSFTHMQELQQKNAQYEAQIEHLKQKNLTLLEEKRLLQDDPSYLERVAREKMGIAKEGEVLYRLTPEVE